MAVEHGPSCCWVGSEPGWPATQAKPFVLCSSKGKIHIFILAPASPPAGELSSHCRSRSSAPQGLMANCKTARLSIF